MFDNLISPDQINFFLVFLEGILSFFSPCVLPLIPVYMGYLAGNAKITQEDGTLVYQQKKVFLHTLCFVLGISFAFFLLGISFTALGTFFNEYKVWFTRIGGALILLMGLVQIGLIKFRFLEREHRLPFHLDPDRMNPLVALVLGFTFSFAWTPCIGPALSSVLILASSAQNAFVGNLLVLLYTLGFVIPFLLLGLFTAKVLNFFQKKRKLVRYTIKVGGALLIVMGIMTMTGWMNGVSGYLNTFVSSSSPAPSPTPAAASAPSPTPEPTAQQTIPAFDFTLTDQYGNQHTLSDYRGQVVFLNFWATWCGPCKQEMPDIEALYQELGKNSGDVVILGVANPGGQETSIQGIQEFLWENNYTYPVVFDETGDVFYDYRISSLPTTFMIDREGNIYGYVRGTLTKDIMENIIDQTLSGERPAS